MRSKITIAVCLLLVLFLVACSPSPSGLGDPSAPDPGAPLPGGGVALVRLEPDPTRGVTGHVQGGTPWETQSITWFLSCYDASGTIIEVTTGTEHIYFDEAGEATFYMDTDYTKTAGIARYECFMIGEEEFGDDLRIVSRTGHLGAPSVTLINGGPAKDITVFATYLDADGNQLWMDSRDLRIEEHTSEGVWFQWFDSNTSAMPDHVASIDIQVIEEYPQGVALICSNTAFVTDGRVVLALVVNGGEERSVTVRVDSYYMDGTPMDPEEEEWALPRNTSWAFGPKWYPEFNMSTGEYEYGRYVLYVDGEEMPWTPVPQIPRYVFAGQAVVCEK